MTVLTLALLAAWASSVAVALYWLARAAWELVAAGREWRAS